MLDILFTLNTPGKCHSEIVIKIEDESLVNNTKLNNFRIARIFFLHFLTAVIHSRGGGN